MEECIVYKNSINEPVVLNVKDNRVYNKDGDLVRISGSTLLADGNLMRWGYDLPQGTDDEQTRMRNWLLYDPILIRFIAERESCGYLSIDNLKELQNLIHNTVEYDHFFSSKESVYLTCDRGDLYTLDCDVYYYT